MGPITNDETRDFALTIIEQLEQTRDSNKPGSLGWISTNQEIRAMRHSVELYEKGGRKCVGK